MPEPDSTKEDAPDVAGLAQTGVKVVKPVPFKVNVGDVDAVVAIVPLLLKVSAPAPEAVIVAPLPPTVKRRSIDVAAPV